MKQNTIKTITPVDMVTVLGSSVIESHLRLDYASESAYIDALTAAAWNSIEDRLGEEYGAVLFQTAQEVLPEEFSLPVDGSRVSGLTMTYVNEDGDTINVAEADISFSPSGYPMQVIYSGERVGLSEKIARPVIVTYNTTAKTVPNALKQAALMLIGHLYENRQGVSDVRQFEVPMAVDYLCRPYQKMQRG